MTYLQEELAKINEKLIILFAFAGFFTLVVVVWLLYSLLRKRKVWSISSTATKVVLNDISILDDDLEYEELSSHIEVVSGLDSCSVFFRVVGYKNCDTDPLRMTIMGKDRVINPGETFLWPYSNTKLKRVRFIPGHFLNVNVEVTSEIYTYPRPLIVDIYFTRITVKNQRVVRPPSLSHKYFYLLTVNTETQQAVFPFDTKFDSNGGFHSGGLPDGNYDCKVAAVCNPAPFDALRQVLKMKI